MVMFVQVRRSHKDQGQFMDMRSRNLASLLACGLIPIAESAAIAQHSSSSPPTGWQVDVAPTTCTLSRSLPSPRPMLFSMSTMAGSDRLRFILIGDDVPKRPTRQLLPIKISFDDQAATFDRKGTLTVLRGDKGTALSIEGLEPMVLDAFAHADTMKIRVADADLGPYALPDHGAAVTALRTCVARRLADWNADPRQFEPGGKLPVALTHRDDWVPNPRLLAIDFAGAAFTATFKVQIAVDGRIDECNRLDSGMGNAEVIACAAVKGRRLFKPAYAPDGTPVRGAASFRVQLFRVSG